jgi:hypothetical protein
MFDASPFGHHKAIVHGVVDLDRLKHTPHIGHTAGGFGLVAGPAQRWEQDGDQDGDNRHDHQQLNEGKTTTGTLTHAAPPGLGKIRSRNRLISELNPRNPKCLLNREEGTLGKWVRTESRTALSLTITCAPVYCKEKSAAGAGDCRRLQLTAEHMFTKINRDLCLLSQTALDSL